MDKIDNEIGTKTMQYLAASGANLGVLAVGMTMGWTSPSLPKLKDSEETPLNFIISDEQGSWIGSLITIGAFLSPLYSGWGADKFGRKWTILASGIPLIVGWILIATASEIIQIYVARMIFGLALGQLYTAVPMYVGEISDKAIRGILGSFLQVFIVIGFLLSYAIGPYVSFSALCLISMVPGLIFMIVFLFLPESPNYLVSKGKMEDASASLQILKGKSALGVEKDLLEIQIGLDQSAKKGSVIDLWTSKNNFRALYLSCGMVVFQQLCGIDVVLFYLQNIFDAANTGLPPEISAIIVGVVQVVASAAALFIIDRNGRRFLIILSAIGMAISMTLLGAFFFLDDIESSVVEYITWLPVTTLILFITFFSIGYGPVPWAVIGELFDPSVKSIGSTIATSLCWTTCFVLTKCFNSIVDTLGMHYAFWIFASFSLFGFIFVFFLLPETKGKSLEEIQVLLGK